MLGDTSFNIDEAGNMLNVGKRLVMQVRPYLVIIRYHPIFVNLRVPQPCLPRSTLKDPLLPAPLHNCVRTVYMMALLLCMTSPLYTFLRYDHV